MKSFRQIDYLGLSAALSANGYVVRRGLSEDAETFHFDFTLPDRSLLIQAYPDKIDDTLVGTAAYRLRPDNTVYISNVATDRAYRRRGIARSAVSFILEKCKEASRIDLVTHPENKYALQFYKSLGFNVESCEENYFGDGEPRLILALTPHQS